MKALPVEEKENIIPYSTKENIEWINNKMEKIGYEG
jgi:tetrahydromethanopterin S-methyltransferase subunit F